MSHNYSARELAEQALRRVRSFAPHDSGADPVHLQIALDHLDLLVAELVGTIRTWWLVPQTVVVPLTGGTNPTDLVDASPDLSDGDFQFLVDIKLRVESSTLDSDLERLTRRMYEEIHDKESQGFPCFVHVDRTRLRPLAYLYPVPGDDSLSLAVTYQKYAPDLTANLGAGHHGFEAPWQRYLIFQCAHDIGTGPVVNLPTSDTDRMLRAAETARARLEAFENQESRHHRRVAYRDF